MILETKRLILRPFEESDAESVYEYAKDPDVGPIAGWPPHTNIEGSLYSIRNFLNGPECYAVCIKENNIAIGAIELKLNGHTDMTDKDDECELGYWLGKPFWGQGIIPEAAKEIIRHGFIDLGMHTIWCGYYDGNTKSKRVQEKCGFKFHHTCNEVPVPLFNEIRIGHTNILTREDWKNSADECNANKIIRLSDRRDLKEKATEWFASKWNVPKKAYLDSIDESFSSAVPSWYLYMGDNKIVAGLGVIENDFHNRKDLTPNVCAVYTEPEYRRRGIAGKMLDFVCLDMKNKGINTLYLLTNHTDFYERYGWKFLCMVQGDGEEELSRMYIKTTE